MFSFSTLEVSLSDRAYLDTRWSMIDGFLLCSSPSELALKLEISKCSETFQPIDYVAIAFGYCLHSPPELEFCFDAMIDMVDNHSFFDSAFKNTKFLKMILKLAKVSAFKAFPCKERARKLFAHIVKKFPSIKRMNFMFLRTKTGKVVRKVKDAEFESWL